MPQNIKSQENSYGGVRRHHPEHDAAMMENFTDDNQDFLPNAAQYNDQEETRFSADDRLTHEHHNKPEKNQGSERYRPSIYSEGGHGRPVTTPAPVRENSDNKDYVMNKDSAQGAQAKYDNTEAKTRHHWWSIFRK